MSPFKWSGFQIFFLRMLFMPMFYFLLWIFYYNAFKDGMDVSTKRKLSISFLNIPAICFYRRTVSSNLLT